LRTEAEFLLMQENREKKRAASGIHSRKGKRGYVGKMYTPVDFLKGKEKRNYVKAGKITVSNLFDEILSQEEFDKLEENEQKNRLMYWRLNHSVEKIKKEMGVTHGRYYRYIKELDLPRIPRGLGVTTLDIKEKRKGKATKMNKETKEQKNTTEPEKILEAEQPKKESLNLLDLFGLNIGYKGTFNSDEIRKMFNKLDILLEDDSSEFEIELKIMQKDKKSAETGKEHVLF
jgi:hypothetical protein